MSPNPLAIDFDEVNVIASYKRKGKGRIKDTSLLREMPYRKEMKDAKSIITLIATKKVGMHFIVL
jgi:hypothetical protein